MKPIVRVGLLLAGLVLGGTGTAQAGKVTYVYTDPQGTPLAEADASGNITARFDYTPYGVPVQGLSASPNGPGYTGHVNDPDTGFVYMQARYYDPSVGRFMGVDPEGVIPANTFSFSRYGYVENNPIVNIDPDGRASKLAQLIELTADGMRVIARVSKERAVSIVRSGKGDIRAGTQQEARQIVNAASGGKGVIKDAGHELKNGTKGSPHYHTGDRNGSHVFWGKIAMGATIVASTLDKAAEAAQYVPDPTPRPATKEDLERTNGIIEKINNATGANIPKVSTDIKPIDLNHDNE